MANMSAEGRHESRYARVKAILEAAAGNSASNYGGLGRFWDLPLDALVEAKVFGVRLIAPAAQASCCGHGESRSTGSGLIHALRGAPPFDGNRFPPFMWDGSRVAEEDIAFIAEWIDEGCPADEGGHTSARLHRPRIGAGHGD